MAARNAVSAGQIYRADRFYHDGTQYRRKYFLVLTTDQAGDVVFRLLTSRGNGRVSSPECSYEDPYPAFYLGFLGDPLTAESWLDLRPSEDYDGRDFSTGLASGEIVWISSLATETLCRALFCAAEAADTTNRQQRLIMDQRSGLGCC